MKSDVEVQTAPHADAAADAAAAARVPVKYVVRGIVEVGLCGV